ncbi:hypothetical protein [Aureimonas sp. N4]|uniref:hypothetical protein n=1 Tax=Aureimonas sp. N4 TaxID=1638165 RepID=UPI0007843185|nr:hypothetical protein [Aureimonas sp. N4]
MIIVVIYMIFVVSAMLLIGIWAWRNFRDSSIPVPDENEAVAIYAGGSIWLGFLAHVIFTIMVIYAVVSKIHTNRIFLDFVLFCALIAAVCALHTLPPAKAFLREFLFYVQGRPILLMGQTFLTDLRDGRTLNLADYDRYYSYRSLWRFRSSKDNASKPVAIQIYSLGYRDSMMMVRVLREAHIERENGRPTRARR